MNGALKDQREDQGRKRGKGAFLAKVLYGMHGGLRECGTIGEVQVIEFVRFSSEESEKESREVNRGPGTQLSKPWGSY